MNHLSPEEEAYNFKTMRHIERVRNLLSEVVVNLLERAKNHDQSKLTSPEVEIFMNAPNLSALTFGSPEYEQSKLQIKVALDHHYAHNSHHPEHHKNGIEDMTLMDLIEMFVDWKASSERQNDGNINKSIETNGRKFNMSPQLIRIFENTAKEMF